MEDDTIGLSNSELDASVPQSFRSIASLRSFDRFTAAANRSRRDAVAFAGLSGDSGWSLCSNLVRSTCREYYELSTDTHRLIQNIWLMETEISQLIMWYFFNGFRTFTKRIWTFFLQVNAQEEFVPQRNTLSLSTSDSKCWIFRSGILTNNKKKDIYWHDFSERRNGCCCCCRLLDRKLYPRAFAVLKIGPFTATVYLTTQPNFRC